MPLPGNPAAAGEGQNQVHHHDNGHHGAHHPRPRIDIPVAIEQYGRRPDKPRQGARCADGHRARRREGIDCDAAAQRTQHEQNQEHATVCQPGDAGSDGQDEGAVDQHMRKIAVQEGVGEQCPPIGITIVEQFGNQRAVFQEIELGLGRQDQPDHLNGHQQSAGPDDGGRSIEHGPRTAVDRIVDGVSPV